MNILIIFWEIFLFKNKSLAVCACAPFNHLCMCIYFNWFFFFKSFNWQLICSHQSMQTEVFWLLLKCFGCFCCFFASKSENVRLNYVERKSKIKHNTIPHRSSINLNYINVYIVYLMVIKIGQILSEISTQNYYKWHFCAR